MILVYVETSAEGVQEVSLETVTFARSLSEAGGGVPIDAVVVGPGSRRPWPPSWRRTASATCTTPTATTSSGSPARPPPRP